MSACSPGAKPDVHIRDIPGIFVPSLLILSLLLCALNAHAQQARPGEFPVGGLAGVDQLPASRLRTQLTALPAPARARALQWLQSFHFTETDLPSLHVDRDGGIFYVCDALPVAPAQAEVPPIAAAAVPVSPFPGSLVFHSRPGAPNVLFLNFSGENVTGTEWNTPSRTNIPAVAFNTDGDLSTFSDAEQVAIRGIWQRVAEDYSPFNIDVTTERPATFNLRTAHALITRSTDANGDDNPSSGAGGVAYVNVFGGGSYARFRPAWVYYDNLASTESYIAEAASHEIGHNLGLSHDGQSGSSYYGGHGSGDTSWGPIMGTGYNRNVSQWSKGEYFHANNTQDDLATIASLIAYRPDDHGNTTGTATALALTGGTNVFSTTPESDPANTNTVNKGVFDRATDVDVFTFITGTGSINLFVRPWVSAFGTRGGNLDVLLQLYNDAGTLISSNDPASQTIAQIQTTLAAGRYYLHVRNSGTGDPLASQPTGYTSYGSLGQFFISGYITSSSPTPGQLAVSPAGGLTSSGTVGGPFSPSSIIYTLTNSGGSSLNWTATKAQSWATLSATSGTLAAGASTTVTVSFNAGANSLVPGTHADTVSFANTTTGNGNTSRSVLLTVNSPGQLAVLPAGGLTSSGTVGGPFSPSSIIYTLTNSGGSSLNWTATKAQSWVTLSATSGTLAAGASATVTVSLNSGANGLVPGNYSDTVSFANTTTGNGNTSRPVSLTVNSAGQLAVLPAGGLTSSGTVGGPFSPSSIIYTLTNSGGSSLNWTATKAQSWVTLSAASGTLAAGASATVTVSLNSGANGLVSGNYSDTVSFANTTTGNGNTSRPVSLTVNSAGQLAILPAGGLTSSGTVGGPFTPSSIIYTLTNSGGSSLNWTATKAQSWVTLSATSGTLNPGASATVTVSLNSGADSLVPGNYTDTVSFANTTTGNGNTSRPVSLTVNSAGQLAILPAGGLTSSGTVGGPFTPSSIIYTLTNSGGSSLNWTATKAQSWVTLSATSGTLNPGASATVTVSLNSGADSLVPGNYTDTVSFANTTTGNGNTSRPVSLTVNSAGQLAILPAGGLTSSGTVGGPFTPSSIIYTLTNSGGSSLNWTATKAQSWVTLSATSGTLAAGASATVTVSLNSGANGLVPGNYSDTVSFANTTTGNGDTSRPVSLTVNSAGQLAILPAGGLTSSGAVGGPFSPSSIVYTLTNSGGSSLNWTAGKAQSWVTLSAASGTLAAGASATVTVSLNAQADTLVPGTHTDTVSFANTTTGNGDTSRPVSLTVNSAGQLAVSPVGGLTSSGTVGGPFTPSSIIYTLTNSGGSSLNWTATKTQSWVTLSAVSGTLAVGASMTVTVSLSAEADSLVPGSYSDTVSFANTTTGNGDTSRPVSLTVNSAGQLAVLPAGGLTSSGTVGGPFTPSSIIYTLTNSGGSSLNWTATKAQSWVTLSATSGTLAAGASAPVTVSLNAGADSLVPGNYSDTISFANATTGNDSASRSVVLTVNPTPGELVVSPASDFSAAGFEGGPFAPDLQTYSLTNAGGSDLDWTITKTANWLTLSAAQGILAAGATTNITVSLNENAGTLVPGSYNDVLEFINVTTSAGSTNRFVTLAVNATPGELAVLTPTNLTIAGTVGGPFSPSSATCTLTNRGGSPLDWAITTTADWLSVSTTGGTLPPGANTEITLALNDDANTLSAGIYTNTIAVTNVTTGTGTNFSFILTVSPPIVSLTATVNNPAWGTVSPTNATYAAGSTVEVIASPAIYFCLAEWTGDATGTNNPLSVSLNTNLSVVAVFRELLTTNHPTPLWWLASLGYTNDFETAASALGANGLPLWQSYIAGLDPSDPASQLRLIAHPANAAGDILSWNTVSDRLYTISSSTNLPGNFAPLPQASDLPASIQRFTNSVTDPAIPRFYRLEVRKP